MSAIDTLSGYVIKAARLDSFDTTAPEGFERVLPVNVIIGKNNAGKSALLDVIECAAQATADKRNPRATPVLYFTQALPGPNIERVFPSNMSGGNIGGNHFQFARPAIGRAFTWTLDGSAKSFVSIEPTFDFKGRGDQVASTLENPFAKLYFRRIAAERDISEEPLVPTIAMAADGTGATNALVRFLTGADLDAAVVKSDLLADLNRIFAPDAHFTDISAHQHVDRNDSPWEVYLHEEKKGRVRLSRSGSGLKVVLLVLACFHVLPRVARAGAVANTIFGFEELENNLHPALLRRLLMFLKEKTESHGCVLLLTTHSSVPIDLFARDEKAQILHVRHTGVRTTVTTVRTHSDRTSILEELDIRASDVLQSNGVIWVEGPSDRVYVRRWIDLWSDSELREGWHYQILFYGGRLLSHLHCGSPEEATEAIRVMLLNRNFAVLLDSDRKEAEDEINETKGRIVAEATSAGAMAWVTAGREIENYIPAAVADHLVPGAGAKLDEPFQSFWVAVDQVEPGKGTRMKENKVDLAADASKLLTKENLFPTRDLATRLDDLCAAIRKWNGLS
jgi:hypothetical protein